MRKNFFLSPGLGGKDHVAVSIAMNKRGIIVAKVGEMRAGKVRSHGDVSVAVMDKAPDISAIDLLARGVATELTRKS